MSTNYLVGCAFLKYETKEQALAALAAVNGKHKMEVCDYYDFVFFFFPLLLGLKIFKEF